MRVNYDESTISRMERDQYPPPDTPTLLARFVPELEIKYEPDLIDKFLALAAATRGEAESGEGTQPHTNTGEADQPAPPAVQLIDASQALSRSEAAKPFTKRPSLRTILIVGVGLVLAALLLFAVISFLRPKGPDARPLLKRGDSSQDVREAQHMLNLFHDQEVKAGRTGLDATPLVEDGIFGPRTERAVISFQRMMLEGLRNQTGIIGPLTWAELYKVGSPATGEVIRRHQGLKCGNHDHDTDQGPIRTRVCAWVNIDYAKHQVRGYGYVELVAGPSTAGMSIAAINLQEDEKNVLSQSETGVQRDAIQGRTDPWKCKGTHTFTVEVTARVNYPDKTQPTYTTSSNTVESSC
jgi:peptidoglycan hydrolase-like protein with peptidoglycan-binding domain